MACKVLLIDADSTIPNLALMKLSTFHKSKGDKVTLIKGHLPYYPGKKKKPLYIPTDYDKIYCSIIFEGNKDYVKGDKIIFGGVGCDIKKKLPPEIEALECDYSLYPQNDISYGFLTRGCPRNCPFCKVPEKEGNIHKVNDLKDIIRHRKVKFLDNNILAYSKHKDIFKQLILLNIKCQFNQGLDIRLLDIENSLLLFHLNYLGEYIFAFDDWAYKNILDEKLPLLFWRKDWQLKFYLYVNPNMPLGNIVKRLEYLKRKRILPYVMRDITCWNNQYTNFYTDLAAYANQPNLFKKMSFSTFLEKRHEKGRRITKGKYLYESHI